MRSALPKDDEYWMRRALRLAGRAAARNEVPIGAVVVKDGQVLGQGYNLRESKNRPTAHAELLAIEAAARKSRAWRLEKATLYVTLEPCVMCWGAIVLARIPRVVYGAADPKAGVCGSLLSLHEERRFNHHPQVTPQVLAGECGKILSDFFRGLREEKKKLER